MTMNDNDINVIIAMNDINTSFDALIVIDMSMWASPMVVFGWASSQPCICYHATMQMSMV